MMKKKKRLLVNMLMVGLALCYFSISLSGNIFWGFDDVVREKSGIKEKAIADLLKTEEFMPKISSPVQDEVVQVPFTITGTISDEIDYIEVKINDKDWQKIEDKPLWAFTVDNLEMGVHTISVHAVEGKQKGPDVSITFKVSVVPTGVSASDGTYRDKVNVSWNTVSGVEKYYVYRSTTAGGTYIEKINTTLAIFSDTSVSNNIEYYYKVKAYLSSVGYSEFSDSDAGKRLFSGPGSITASDGTYADKVRVSWTAVSGAEKYYVYRSSSSGGVYTEVKQTNGTTFDDTSVSNNVEYYYKVKAYLSSVGYSEFSDSDAGKRLFSGPGSITASDGTYIDKVRVTWTAVSGAEKYYVYRSTSAGGVYSEIGNTTSTNYDDSTVSTSTLFYYKARAYLTGIGYSEYSGYDDGYKGILAPTGVSASDDLYDKVNVIWNSVPNAEKYYIYRSLSSGSGYVSNANITGISYDDTTAGVGTNYYYKIRAWSTAMGYSPYSSYDGGVVVVDPFSGVIKREMVSVPGGTYTQTDTDANSFSHTISAFQMGKYEVTYELWYTVYTWAVSNGYNFANAGDEGHDGSAGAVPTGAKYEPVTTVNWRDTMVWCNAYSEMSGFAQVYKNGSSQVIKDARDSNATECDNAVSDWGANGYRLPTEGEWQYTASYKDGASWTPYDYASGATADYNNAGATGLVAWYGANSGSKTQDVGTKIANALGIYDMSGNVWEWCWDWHGSWPGTGQTDYRGPISGSFRVGCGGCWYYSANYLQVGNRKSLGSPYSEYDDVGFRLVRTP